MASAETWQRAIGRKKAATLLILRELMHHLGFEAIVARSP
jgi:hypothetical protein